MTFCERTETILDSTASRLANCAIFLAALALILLALPVTLDIVLRHLGTYFPGAFEIQELMMGVLTVTGMIAVSGKD
ncbi:MAG: hypothetical protein MJ061_01280, partial [Mailhella sp.]|nr:hypothetical protein [Mailhella sp.]